MGQTASGLLNGIFRFDRFEANRESYHLRSDGRTVRLERIPLELLFLLLERRGSLVEREEIVARLWRDVSFMDTERSINTAIRKIRKALDDNPIQPRFIETVVGKGYRFVAPLIQESASGAIPGHARATPTASPNGGEIRLREFSIDTTGITPVLTCGVAVGKIDLGRIPLIEIELPDDVTLPLQPKDRLLLTLHGVRVSLTSKAVQALHAFSISTLQSGLRTRISDDRLHPDETSAAEPAPQFSTR
jgi:DNA-binding winged helix-turn-helix (wHTH) protein